MSAPTLPTDLEILNAIYTRYYDTYVDFDPTAQTRAAKAFIPVDCIALGEDLGIDADVVFSRLYYHLDPKYRSTRPDSAAIVPLFQLEIQGSGRQDRHVVHFPLLTSVLAALQAEHKKYLVGTTINWFSLAVSAIALLVSFLRASAK